MSEVIKLHQDEGVINLLHALPASRRRPSSSYNSSQSPTSMMHHQQPHQHQRRPSNEVERGHAAKGLSQTQKVLPFFTLFDICSKFELSRFFFLIEQLTFAKTRPIL